MARAFEPTSALLAPLSLEIGTGFASSATRVASGSTPLVFDTSFDTSFS